MTDREYVNFLSKCANISYTDYSWLKDHCYKTLERPCSPNTRNEHLAILDLIKEHEERERQWIPCSERLPEVGSQVLVCYEFNGKRNVFIADFFGDHKFHGLEDEYLTTEARKHRKAIAWMQLPNPYKAEGSEEK